MLMNNDVFVCHISPFTQLLDMESRLLIGRMRTFPNKDFVHACIFSHRAVNFFKYKKEQLALCYDE